MKDTKISICDNHDEKLFGMSSYSHHDDEYFILNIFIFLYV